MLLLVEGHAVRRAMAHGTLGVALGQLVLARAVVARLARAPQAVVLTVLFFAKGRALLHAHVVRAGQRLARAHLGRRAPVARGALAVAAVVVQELCIAPGRTGSGAAGGGARLVALLASAAGCGVWEEDAQRGQNREAHTPSIC